MGRTTSSTSRKRRKQNGGAGGHGSAAEATLQALQEKRCVCLSWCSNHELLSRLD
jgi:hypothetical protein